MSVSVSPWRLSVAPMMGWTDRHCRYFHRLLTQHTLLYTEMVTTGALIHGNAAQHLHFNAEEHPVALQLGGNFAVQVTPPISAIPDRPPVVDTAFGQVAVTHLSLNDHSIEGLACVDRPVFSVQYHPEASPGPRDSHYLFKRFADLMRANKGA